MSPPAASAPAPRRALRRLRRHWDNLRADRARRRILSGRFRLLVVSGPKRSGNHVFLNWYLSQHSGAGLHYNHVRPDQWPTDRDRRSIHPGAADAMPVLVLSYEDRDLDAILDGPLAAFRDDHAERIAEAHLALVLRDPRNLVASRFRKWPGERDDPARRAALAERLVRHASAALSPPGTLRGLTVVSVHFDPLVGSPSYRDVLADSLSIPRGARGLDEVTAYGHGSSFDGTAKGGAQMDVGARWQFYGDDPVFADVMARPDMARIVRDYAAAVAPWRPATDGPGA